MKVRILSISLNPSRYDVSKLAEMSYDEAKAFAENDTVNCMNCRNFTINPNEVQELTFHADVVRFGDTSDTVLNWLKVSEH